MIIRRKHWLLAAFLFVLGPLMGLVIGLGAGAHLSGDASKVDADVLVVDEGSYEATSPDLVLPNGKAIELADVAPGRTVALIVMKDADCPVCQRQLVALSQRLDEVQRTGATVVGLSDASHCKNRALVEHLGLKFPIVSDRNHSLLERLDLHLPERDHVMPGVIIVDESGQVETVYRGRTPGQPQEEMIIERLWRR